MGVERRKRTVEELYDATEVVLEQKITPVLRGRYCMQGPVDESDDSIAKNMVSPGLEKEFGKCSLNQEVHMSGESGTCNVCSAPCSSCMHLKRAYMGSKSEEFSDETFHVNASSQCSAIDADALSYVKSRARDGLLHTNLRSVNSNRDYSSENADSRAPLGSSGGLSCTEDVKMLKKFSSCRLVADDDVFVKSAQQDLLSKKGNPKGIEGHGDNISCISESRHSTGGAGINNVNLDRKDLTFQSASLDYSSPGVSAKKKSSYKLSMSELPVYGDGDSGSSSLKSHSPLSHSQRSKSLSGSANEMDVEQIPSTQVKKEQPESSMQYVNSSTEELSSGLRSLGNQCGHDGSNSMVSMKTIIKLEGEDEPPDRTLKCGAQEEQDEKLNKLVDSSDLCEPPFQVVSGNESDDSDIMEHDVKVCDICGDAGREDMLAICSRCTDGAEHIYCMRETLPNVPDGDWLCEECNLIEGVKTKKTDAEDNRIDKDHSKSQVSGKKHAENVCATSNMKRQTLEGGAGLPKTSSCVKVGEGLFKNLDKGKLKPVPQPSSGNDSSDDVSGMTHSPLCVPRFQTPKGSLSKSYSFNTSNLKPKVKLVDEYIPISKKGDGDYPHREIKSGPAKMLRKSMSWKPSNSSRLNATESKVKMLSSKFLHARDPKGLKPVKECSYFEKKNLSKFDHSRVSSVTTDSAVLTPKADQKYTSPGDTGSSLSISRDIKQPMQSEGTLNTFQKSTSSQVHRTADTLVSPVASLPYSSGEQKKNIVSPKEEPCSSSLNSYDYGLLRSRESVNLVDKNQESSACLLKPSVTNGDGASSKSSLNDLCCTKSSKEDIDNGNKLKAAIQAAVLKRPEIYRKKRVMDSSDEVALTSSELLGGIASQDRLIGPHKFKNEISVERAHVRQDIGRSSADFDRKTSTAKQLGVNLNDGSSSIKLLKCESFMNTTENLTGKDFPSHSPIMSFHLNVSGIPEHEYIWQGSFEVYRAGKRTGSHDGIQAHLSMTASPKVLDVVNKFPSNVILDEVPRLSMWPSQFHDSGAKEDNIALFIFAKDIESYERNYKSLLGNMMSNDLALKANFGDVEFLVFPSIHLPEKSQRWNTLFYLWGGFRGRRVNCMDSLKKLNIPSLNSVPVEENISAAAVTSSNDRACSNPCDTVLASGSSNHIFNKSNRDFHHRDYSFQQTHKGSLTNSDSHLSSPISPTSSSVSGGEMVCAGNLDLGSSGRWSEKAPRPSFLVARKGTLGGKVHSRDNFEGKETSSLMIIKHDNDEYATNDSTSDGSVSAEGVNYWEFNHRKRSQLHLSEPAPSTSMSNSQMSLNNRNVVMMGKDGANKKPRTDNGCSTSYSRRNSTDLLTNDMGLHPLIKETRNYSFNMNNPPEDSATSETFVFPVDSNHVNDFRLETNCVEWNTQPTSIEDRLSLAPNLELALGAETKLPSKAVLPLFVGLVGEKHGLTKPPDKGTGQKEDDSESLSLSLSFPSFPFPEKDDKAGKKAASQTEQLLTENPHGNPLLLFRGSSEK